MATCVLMRQAMKIMEDRNNAQGTILYVDGWSDWFSVGVFGSSQEASISETTFMVIQKGGIRNLREVRSEKSSH